MLQLFLGLKFTVAPEDERGFEMRVVAVVVLAGAAAPVRMEAAKTIFVIYYLSLSVTRASLRRGPKVVAR